MSNETPGSDSWGWDRVMGTHHKDGVEKLLFTVLKVRVLLADKHYIKIQQYVRTVLKTFICK